MALFGGGFTTVPCEGGATSATCVNCPDTGSLIVVAAPACASTFKSCTVGAKIPMVIVTSSEDVPAAFVALTVTLDVPATVGVPEICPLDVFALRPGGSPVAAKLVGLFAAVIW